jgi:hypothetical protein
MSKRPFTHQTSKEQASIVGLPGNAKHKAQVTSTRKNLRDKIPYSMQ